MFDQVRHAILPPMGLQHVLRNWSEITEALADTPRKRVRQTEAIKELL
jgi:hypothetical protein